MIELIVNQYATSITHNIYKHKFKNLTDIKIYLKKLTKKFYNNNEAKKCRKEIDSCKTIKNINTIINEWDIDNDIQELFDDAYNVSVPPGYKLHKSTQNIVDKDDIDITYDISVTRII